MRSYLLGCKALLAVMRANGWYSGLSDVDRTLLQLVLPETVPIGPDSLAALQARHRWVIKPAFGSGGKGVVIGRFSDEATWSSAIAEAQDGRWIAQAYVPIPSCSVPVIDGGQLINKRFFANWNPFFFGGVFAGAITRASLEPVVGISAGGALLPAVVAHE